MNTLIVRLSYFFWVILLAFGLPLTSLAFSVDATGSGTGTGGNVSWTHVTAGNLLVVEINNGVGVNSGSCTYNSVSMTDIGSRQNGDSGFKAFYLKNPDNGSHTVSCTTGQNHLIAGTSVTYSGLDSAFTIEGTNGATASSVSVTTTFDNALIVGFGAKNGSMSAGTDTTQRISRCDGNGYCGTTNDMGTFPTSAGTYTVAPGGTLSIGTAFGVAPTPPTPPPVTLDGDFEWTCSSNIATSTGIGTTTCAVANFSFLFIPLYVLIFLGFISIFLQIFNQFNPWRQQPQ